ncbi:hypothetical protein ACJMK2_038876 [Sinanodonta woodiana]|uniref:Uncharacterized protein n=1 Tax=Sinanodonta woodiana TaxID=1069815 RepID=A0ABD3WAC2_SINWO
MNFIVVLLALAGLAYSQNASVEMGVFSLPEESLSVILDDLKYTLHNITPAFKLRLDFLLHMLGMSLDDLEQVLDNPPEEIKQMFGPSGMSISDVKSRVRNLPKQIQRMIDFDI